MENNEKFAEDQDRTREGAPTEEETRELDRDEIERMARQKHGDPIESARGFLFREH